MNKLPHRGGALGFLKHIWVWPQLLPGWGCAELNVLKDSNVKSS